MQTTQELQNNLSEPVQDGNNGQVTLPVEEVKETRELQAAKLTLAMSEQCLSRIQCNQALLEFLANAHPTKSTKYLRKNYYPIYSVITREGRTPLQVQGFVTTLIRINIAYYTAIQTKLEAGEIDEAYILLMTIVNRFTFGPDGLTRGPHERERDIFKNLLDSISTFRSPALETLQEYMSYEVSPTQSNLKLPEQYRTKTFSVDFNKIEELKIHAIQARIAKAAGLIEKFSKNNNPKDGEEILKSLKSLETKTIPIASKIHSDFCKKINALFAQASGSTEKKYRGHIRGMCSFENSHPHFRKHPASIDG